MMTNEMGRLTPGELRVLMALKAGPSDKAIARELGIAEGTVKVHMKAINRKLGTSNRTQTAMKVFAPSQFADTRKIEAAAWTREFYGPAE